MEKMDREMKSEKKEKSKKYQEKRKLHSNKLQRLEDAHQQAVKV